MGVMIYIFESKSMKEGLDMRNQKEPIHRDAPRFSRPQVPVRGILIALVIGLVFYTTLAFVNYIAGGPRVHANVYASLTNPPTPSLMLVFTIIMLTLAIRKMQGNQRPWYTQPPILQGIGFLAATLGTLIIGEVLGNDLVSHLIGWSLAGLFVIFMVTCMLSSIIIANSLPVPKERLDEATAQPKEAREDEAGPYQQQTTL